MSIKYTLDAGAYRITRAYPTDAGGDIRAMRNARIPAHGSAIFHTGVHVQIPDGCFGLVASKSGLNINHDLTCTGIIDVGYTGEIIVKLYNDGETDYCVEAGDKIAQLLILPCCLERFEEVDNIRGGERGSNGFGSTGK